ncbi:transcriptional regulator [Dactylosporangium sp. CA-139066]|uniref:transcriptional regulator n=1 Tax=Dactylosporangium sp. CA-139066 TaxID=3239930 RepID=UPI003D94A190
MAQTRINVPALYAALDGARRSRQLSWRQVAREVGCSPSTMTRLANDFRPDADAFMALTQWLRMPAEAFWMADGDDADSGDKQDQQDGKSAPGREQPELLAQLNVLLRARKDLGDEERQHLYNVVEAALKLNAVHRAARSR